MSGTNPCEGKELVIGNLSPVEASRRPRASPLKPPDWRFFVGGALAVARQRMAALEDLDRHFCDDAKLVHIGGEVAAVGCL
ncbi:hypothetical protein JTL47_35585, partial [Pseudomonas aeruginosa]|nr:hypothetical protein [Pseudomonas aeruginosa]